MTRMRAWLLIGVVAAALSACGADEPADAAAPVVAAAETSVEQVQDTVSAVAVEVQDQAADVLTPVVIDVREAVQELLPEPPAPAPVASTVSPAAVDLIVRFEIISPSYYVKRLQRPIWPKGASGITWAIGYDGGHQTRQQILADWSMHPDGAELSTTAGITGQRARIILPAYRHIVTPLPMAQQVFADSTLPRYATLAERTFEDGWERLPPNAQGSLTATVYNRGASMRGTTRRHMRALRDVCVPAGDVGCMVEQYLDMCAIWQGTPNGPGLCRRYRETADLAVAA